MRPVGRRRLTLWIGVTTLLAACRGGGSPGAAGPTQPSNSPIASTSDELYQRYLETVDLATADIQAYWAAVFPQVYGKEYKSLADLISYTSASDAPLCDGVRLRENNAYYCPSGDYIAWDERHFLFPFYTEIGDFAVTFILAHEWGHAIAARGQANLPADVFGELQADCFAGAYGRDAESRGVLGADDLDEAVLAMFQLRDAPDTPWLDPGTHGRALDRISAFTAGYNQGPWTCANYSLPTPPNPPPGAA